MNKPLSRKVAEVLCATETILVAGVVLVAVVLVGTRMLRHRGTVATAERVMSKSNPDITYHFVTASVTYNASYRRTVEGTVVVTERDFQGGYHSWNDSIAVTLVYFDSQWHIDYTSGSSYISLWDRLKQYLRSCLP
jgi:hypothetical protein